jgi:hypothetical protein
MGYAGERREKHRGAEAYECHQREEPDRVRVPTKEGD